MCAALQGLGYTDREAQFIELAALHSGYFVRRQFNAFLGQPRGRAAADFVEKLIRRDHATCDVFWRHAHVYHLSAKPLYTRLGQPDNRHRRHRSPFGIKAKLMALDYVLAHREDRFLATEDARVQYFTEQGVDRARLPQLVYRARRGGQTTARYFVEKFPLAVHADGSIGLTYIDAGEYAVDGLATFLKRYTPLIAVLPNVCLTYVADTSRNFNAATAGFQSWTKAADDTTSVPRSMRMIERMLRYFADWQKVEADDLTRFSAERLRELRADRARFQNPDCEVWHRLWKDAGEAAVRRQLVDAISASAEHRVRFATYQLPHDYSALGAPIYVE